ncbi:MAG: beta-ketoacyl-[acyl-carrier-protein] synthase family protein [Telluria sp.]|nr:beta-ketoacyl-[acyl-carrier-protein] synthase family protein [Telluria sp.]
MKRSETERRVVVTGYGALCALGEDSQQIWDSIMQYRLGYRIHELKDKSINAKFFGFMEPNKKRYEGLPKSITKMLPVFAKNALAAAREAIDMAFGKDADLDKFYDPFQRGVIVGTGWGGLDEANANHETYRMTGTQSSFATILSMNNVATAAISMNWRARGYQNTTISACAAGTMAIGDAFAAIRSGAANMMLAGGSESLRGESSIWAIDIIQALSKEQEDPARACCPFNQGRNGFILSEGAAILCLEDYDHAVRRGANILAEITGYANYSDAYDMTAPAKDMGARVRAIQMALQTAGKAPSSLSYINAHGTSTPLNDVNESESIKMAIGETAYAIPISSTKSYTGHLIGAAGAVESVICLKAIETGILPATIHLNDPDPACDLNYIPNQHMEGVDVKVALNLSFGFGGANCAVIFEKCR